MIGGGGFTYPSYYLNKYIDKTLDVVETDPKMTEIAIDHFDLNISNDRLKVYTQDGRTFLNYSKNKYDVILIDAFKVKTVPFELTTYEAMINAKKMLNENGVVITNIISSIDGKDSDLLKYEYSTYRKVFDDVKVYRVHPAIETESQNIILIGLKGSNIDEDKYIEYERYNRNEINIVSDKKILTDDYCPIGN